MLPNLPLYWMVGQGQWKKKTTWSWDCGALLDWYTCEVEKIASGLHLNSRVNFIQLLTNNLVPSGILSCLTISWFPHENVTCFHDYIGWRESLIVKTSRYCMKWWVFGGVNKWDHLLNFFWFNWRVRKSWQLTIHVPIRSKAVSLCQPRT